MADNFPKAGGRLLRKKRLRKKAAAAWIAWANQVGLNDPRFLWRRLPMFKAFAETRSGDNADEK